MPTRSPRPTPAAARRPASAAAAASSSAYDMVREPTLSAGASGVRATWAREEPVDGRRAVVVEVGRVDGIEQRQLGRAEQRQVGDGGAGSATPAARRAPSWAPRRSTAPGRRSAGASTWSPPGPTWTRSTHAVAGRVALVGLQLHGDRRRGPAPTQRRLTADRVAQERLAPGDAASARPRPPPRRRRTWRRRGPTPPRPVRRRAAPGRRRCAASGRRRA